MNNGGTNAQQAPWCLSIVGQIETWAGAWRRKEQASSVLEVRTVLDYWKYL